jgi:hypothetical protein
MTAMIFALIALLARAPHPARLELRSEIIHHPSLAPRQAVIRLPMLSSMGGNYFFPNGNITPA